MAVEESEQTIKLLLREVRSAAAKRPVLVVLQGPHLGLTVQIAKENTVIGRGVQADIVIKDEVASRQHAEIIRLAQEGGCYEYYIRDLGSTNGTFLNGARVTSQQLLEDGDKIKVGNHMMKFAMLDEYEAEFQDRLHRMTQSDELTGLRSRRSLFADIDRLVTQAARSNRQPITVLMLDVDFFKRVNDSYGHLVGSQTIREVAKIIREEIGTVERAARYGGEEYLAYLIGGREEGFEIAEKIRERIEAHPFPASPIDPDKTMRITISIGVATFPKDGLTALEIVQKADQALYRAKSSGRNQTCAYDKKIDKADAFRPTVDAQAIIYGPADAQ